MSDTPRTDKAEFTTGYSDHGLDCVDSGFARTLERENAAMRAAIEKYLKAFEAIRWGWDGDCGSKSLTWILEEAIEPVRDNG